jgi:uncharacterized membrane protein YesL
MMLAVTPAFALLIASHTPWRVLFALVIVTTIGLLLPVVIVMVPVPVAVKFDPDTDHDVPVPAIVQVPEPIATVLDVLTPLLNPPEAPDNVTL